MDDIPSEKGPYLVVSPAQWKYLQLWSERVCLVSLLTYIIKGKELQDERWMVATISILARIGALPCVCHPMDKEECRCLGPAAARLIEEKQDARTDKEG